MHATPRSRAVVALPRTSAAIAAAARECRARVNRRAWMSAGAAVIPVPGLDVAVDIRNVMRLLTEINQTFGLTPEQIELLAPHRRINVTRLLRTMNGSVVGRYVTREIVLTLMKSIAKRLVAKQTARWVPLAGQVAAAGMSLAAIRWIGYRHIDDCVVVARALLRSGGSS